MQGKTVSLHLKKHIYMARRSRMYYIWCDESDKEGEYYSNFYGGILIGSKDLPRVLKKMEQKVAELDITEEIKWQKVNEHMFSRYLSLVDFIFDLLEVGLIKIRIFFRHNQYVPKYLSREQMRNEYSLLYYQFIKHGFGLAFSNINGKPIHLQIALDELPINEVEKHQFKNYLFKLNEDKRFQDANIKIRKEDILEIDSRTSLPLQMMDLILGAICFRLNEKHRHKLPGTRRRGKRTILKEKLYKQIYFRISQLRKGFNVGVSTGFSVMEDRWTMPYRHWSFIPKDMEIDKTKTKTGVKELIEGQKNSPAQPTE